MFSQADLFQIQQKGITVDEVNRQLTLFKNGLPYLKLIEPATRHHGIMVFTSEEIEQLIADFERLKVPKKLVKFVPASGAATRMFKSFYDWLAQPSESLQPGDFSQIITQLELFAFYDDLKEVLKKNNLSVSELLANKSYHKIISFILNGEGLNYGNLPKGLLKFHTYPEGNRTSMEEHLAEGAIYVVNDDRSVYIHFTVSPEHIQAVSHLFSNVKAKYEKMYNVVFNLNLTIQKPSTDTIAVDGSNNPFKNVDGSLLFRPGGHGALLDNLNEIDGDILFIKNIDNVVPDRLKDNTITFKKALAGLLLRLQQRVFEYLETLENNSHADELLLAEIKVLIESHYGYVFPSSFSKMNLNDRKAALVKILNRPIRVCGMVQNVGEPGGGPYWTDNKDGSQSLQILESNQINMDDDKQRDIFRNATHFNPVDLVITLRDFKGRKFDLTKFRDPDTGFITIKSKDGKELKAMELPGLWNGAMAFWNTVFVEVPLITFNPVKTLNDLLRIEHQNY